MAEVSYIVVVVVVFFYFFLFKVAATCIGSTDFGLTKGKRNVWLPSLIDSRLDCIYYLMNVKAEAEFDSFQDFEKNYVT